MKPLQGNLDVFLIRASRGPFRLTHKTQGPSHIHIPKGLSIHAQHNLYLVIIFYCQSLSTPRPHPSPVECRLHKSKGIFSFLHLYDPRPRTVATQWAHHKHLQDR